MGLKQNYKTTKILLNSFQNYLLKKIIEIYIPEV